MRRFSQNCGARKPAPSTSEPIIMPSGPKSVAISTSTNRRTLPPISSTRHVLKRSTASWLRMPARARRRRSSESSSSVFGRSTPASPLKRAGPFAACASAC
jgi:hypothetical protein